MHVAHAVLVISSCMHSQACTSGLWQSFKLWRCAYLIGEQAAGSKCATCCRQKSCIPSCSMAFDVGIRECLQPRQAIVSVTGYA